MFLTGSATVSSWAVALMRGERHLQDAVLAGERDRLVEIRPDRRIEFRACILRLSL